MKVELTEAQWLRATVALSKDIDAMERDRSEDPQSDGFWETRIADAQETLRTIQKAGNL